MLAQQALCLLSCLPVPSLQLHQSHESLCSNGQRLSGHRVSQASSRRTSIYTSRLYTAAGVISEGFFLSLFSPLGWGPENKYWDRDCVQEIYSGRLPAKTTKGMGERGSVERSVMLAKPQPQHHGVSSIRSVTLQSFPASEGSRFYHSWRSETTATGRETHRHSITMPVQRAQDPKGDQTVTR